MATGLGVPGPDRIVIAVPGTSETGPHADPHVEIGMLGEATKQLTNQLFEKHFLPYDALYGQGTSYRQSRDYAIEKLTSLMLNYGGTEIYLLGYSQGAAVVTLAVKRMIKAVLAEDARAKDYRGVLDRIKGIYLIANPHRQPGMIYGADPGGEGISFSPEDGWWGEMKNLVMEIGAPGDIISSSDPNTTFLKRLPLYTIDMNWANTIGWAKSIYDVMTHTNPFTLYPELRKEFGFFTYLARYWNTARALKNYIKTNVHVKYVTYYPYEGQSCMRAIANDIIQKAVM